MQGRFMFLSLTQLLKCSPVHKTNTYGSIMWVPLRHKSSGGRRPKKKIYHRVHELDRVMDLQKKPALILQLKSIIESQKLQSLFLRDLEKQVGFIQKWNFMAVIEKYPSIFYVDGGNRAPPSVRLTEKAQKIANEEAEARNLMEPILVKNLRKLLMLSVDCRVPVEKIEFIESELGLPNDFKDSLIPKYPEYFSVKDVNGKAYLNLENWDSSLAVTAREERLAHDGVFNSAGVQKKVRISKDGNFQGPYAFRLSFPVGFRPNMSYLEELQRWQKMEFPSPYLNARRFEAKDPKARKRMVAVLHELLSLTMEKRMTSAQLDAFHSECLLPSRLLLCLIRHHGSLGMGNYELNETLFTTQVGTDIFLKPSRPALVVSSTSWTPDEDFDILLEAAVMYDRRVAAVLNEDDSTNEEFLWKEISDAKQYLYPRLLFIIIGKGPEKEKYEEKIKRFHIKRVAFRTMWLSAEDYPLLLGSADLGVCLHTSSSGLDLPMKFVDMFSCGLPACAVSYSCIEELVKVKKNGLLFSTSLELADELLIIFKGFPDGCDALKLLRNGTLEMGSSARWATEWEEHAKPLVSKVVSWSLN